MKRTKVRTTELIPPHGYGKYVIEILDKEYPDQPNSKSLTIIGSIEWQCTVSEVGKRDDLWYGMKIRCEVDPYRAERMAKMAKIAMFVKANRKWDTQPKDILELLNAERYFRHDLKFIPESQRGWNYYHVCKNGGSVYAGVVAKTKAAAVRKAIRLYNTHEVVFDHVVY